ncbi:MAG: hypothetical protein HKN23_05465 [Verrucomicrobiales bacterium]|nr:hypothetical protein [Verrucomicrobiales bacterium]
MKTDTAAAIRQLLSAAAARRTGEKGAFAGMTGTTCGFTDNWFIGFNDRYTWGVRIGYDRPREIFPNAFAGKTALPIWKDIAGAIPSGNPEADSLFKQLPESIVCLESGACAGSHCREAGHNLVALPAYFRHEFGSTSTPVCKIDRKVPKLAEAEKEEPAIRAVPVGTAPSPWKRPEVSGPVIPTEPVVANQKSLRELFARNP